MPLQPKLTILDPHASDEPFPPVEMAWDEPDGLLAVNGDLSPKRLLNAYASGIFPWFNENEPIYWWSPATRAVLFPEKIQISRSLRKTARNKGYQLSFDTDFAATMTACAAPRSYSESTWITSEMCSAYIQLHKLGHAHSVEIRNKEGKLVGGLYGVVHQGVFCGESMFSTERDTSKLALLGLVAHLHKWNYTMVDCQLESSHLMSLGAEAIPRKEYIRRLKSSAFPSPHEWKVIKNLDISRWAP